MALCRERAVSPRLLYRMASSLQAAANCGSSSVARRSAEAAASPLSLDDAVNDFNASSDVVVPSSNGTLCSRIAPSDSPTHAQNLPAISLTVLRTCLLDYARP